MSKVELILGDCLEVMPTLPQVDSIITDIPYGTTACKWDAIIPFEPMWAAVKLVLKPRGVFVTTASQPFTSKLVVSNTDWFKEELIWKKDKASNFMLAKIRSLKYHENILVFSPPGQFTYNPQKWDKGTVPNKNGKAPKVRGNGAYNTLIEHTTYAFDSTLRYTGSVIYFNTPKNNDGDNGAVHPTQKPVALYEYLIRTYTNEGDTVLDITMGSGTTGVACVNTSRNFIGIEIDEDYYRIAERRIHDAQMQPSLLNG